MVPVTLHRNDGSNSVIICYSWDVNFLVLSSIRKSPALSGLTILSPVLDSIQVYDIFVHLATLLF